MNDIKHPLCSALPACLGLAAMALITPALAADNPGAHRHGHGQLQMAIEGNRVDLSFTSPAYNLAGFERDAQTPEEERHLQEIEDWLGTHPLVEGLSASCSVTGAEVHYAGSQQNDHHDKHSHYEHRHGDEGHQGHDGHGHGDSREGDSHREYQVSQQLECNELGVSQGFDATVMTRFPELEALAVQWVSEAGQGSVRLEGGNTRFTVGD